MSSGILHILLALLPVTALIAFAIAEAGHRAGNVGARTTVFTIWVALVLVQTTLSGPPWCWLRFSIHTGISLAIIFIPMEALRDFNWARGRLIGGLLGAVGAAFTYPLVFFILEMYRIADCR